MLLQPGLGTWALFGLVTQVLNVVCGYGCSKDVYKQVEILKQQIKYLENALDDNCKTRCPSGYVWLHNSCYRVAHKRRPWQKAQLDCARDGAQLVSFETALEERWVRAFLSQEFGHIPHAARFYTSGNELDKPGVWKWGTGPYAQEIQYTNWTKGEPNDHDGEKESCIEFDLDRGWNDVPCYFDFMWICEIEPHLPWAENYHDQGRYNSEIYRQMDEEATNAVPGSYKPYWTQPTDDKAYQSYSPNMDNGQTKPDETGENDEKESESGDEDQNKHS